MRIVHVEDCFDPTAGYQVNDLVEAARGTGDEIFIITSNDMTPFHKSVDLEEDLEFTSRTGAQIIRLPVLASVSSRRVLSGLWGNIRFIDPDLVFLHGIGDFKDLHLLAPADKWVTVRDCHMSKVASVNPLNELYAFLFRHTFARAINATQRYAKVFALGDEEHETLRHLGISERKIERLPHGYNASMVSYDDLGRRAIRQAYGIDDSDTLISYIGKFDGWKRPDLLFDILEQASLEQTPGEVRLLFLGPKEPGYMERFSERLARSPWRTKVVIDDSKAFYLLKKYFSASDICIFPRQTSLSAVHAQVCGAEVIMENHAANRERVVRQENLFAEGDLAHAASILERLVREGVSGSRDRYVEKLRAREYQNQLGSLRALVTTKGHLDEER